MMGTREDLEQQVLAAQKEFDRTWGLLKDFDRQQENTPISLSDCLSKKTHPHRVYVDYPVPEIRPCPRCGKEGFLMGAPYANQVYVVCSGNWCGTESDWMEDACVAIAQWNRAETHWRTEWD